MNIAQCMTGREGDISRWKNWQKARHSHAAEEVPRKRRKRETSGREVYHARKMERKHEIFPLYEKKSYTHKITKACEKRIIIHVS